MHIKSFFHLLFVLMMFMASNFASQKHEPSVIEELYTIEDQSILGYEEGRFYLNPERLHLSPEGIFLRSDTKDIYHINAVFFDRERCAYYQTDHWICSGGHRVPISYTMCPICGAKK